MGGLEDGVSGAVVDIRARCNADAAHLRSQSIRAVVTVQVQGGHHAVLLRVDENLLQEGVADAVFHHRAVRQAAPRAVPDWYAPEFTACYLVAPVAEGAFRKLHDIALVHQRHEGTVIFHSMLDGRAHQTLRALLADGLDAEAGGAGEAHLVRPCGVGVGEPAEECLRLFAAALELDAGVDIFRVLAENNHVHLAGLLDRGLDSLEVTHGAHAGVQVQPLAQGHVQRANAAAHGGGQRAFDAYQIAAEGLHRFIRQPRADRVVGFLPGQNFFPRDAALAPVGGLHGGVDHALGRSPDVRPGAVADDVGNDGVIRHPQSLRGHADGGSFAHVLLFFAVNSKTSAALYHFRSRNQ